MTPKVKRLLVEYGGPAKTIHDGIVADLKTLGASATMTDAQIWSIAHAGAHGNPTGAYCVLTQPSSSLTLSVNLKSNSGAVSVWWGDGTAIQFVPVSQVNSTTVSRTWGTGANMTVVIAGPVSYFYDSYGAQGGVLNGLGKTLTYLYLSGTGLTCSGSVAGLTSSG